MHMPSKSNQQGATAKLAQNSALSARREKRHLHPLLQLRFSTMRTWKQSFRMNLASRQPRGHRNCNFRGKSRRLKLEKMHMNVHIFNRFHLYWKSRCNFTFYIVPMFFFVDRLGFSLSPSRSLDLFPNWHWVKIVAVFVSAKTLFLGTKPTQIQEMSPRWCREAVTWLKGL